jgi:S-formylglutathione hydrolase FrmB
MIKPLAALPSALAVLVLVACASSPRPDGIPAASVAPAMPERSYTPEGCIIERFEVPSPSMGRVIKGLVILPPAYSSDPDRHFPILYALHGKDAPYTSWSEMQTLRAALATKPMIVACFDGDRHSMYLDADLPQTDYLRQADTAKGARPRPVRSRFTTFFFLEFMPWVDQHYRTDGQKRMLTGFSMGAYGALHFLLQKPEAFVSISGLSGAFSPCADGDATSEEFFKHLIGPVPPPPAKPDRYRSADVLLGLEEFFKSGRTLPPCYFVCGTEDYWRLLSGNRALGWMLAAHGRADSYHELPGKHDWAFWKAAAPDMVDFHWRTVSSPAAAPAAPAAAPVAPPASTK